MKLLRRFYIYSLRLLPFAFVLFGVGNFYFLYRKSSVDSTNVLRNLSNLDSAISNRIVYVETFVSNELRQARSQIRYLKTSFSTNVSQRSDITLSPPSVSNVVPSVSIQGRYFIAGSCPQVDIDGFYYKIGSDFGYGEVKHIYPRLVITSTHRVNITPVSPSLPRPVEPNRPQFAFVEDYPSAAEYSINARYYADQMEKGQYNSRGIQ